jgi:hypothetical protein
MALSTGARLGVYEISSLLGAGGMWEAYRARDPRLAREIAIKLTDTAIRYACERRFREKTHPERQVGPLNDRAALQFDCAARSFGQRDAAEARRRISKRL